MWADDVGGVGKLRTPVELRHLDRWQAVVLVAGSADQVQVPIDGSYVPVGDGWGSGAGRSVRFARTAKGDHVTVGPWTWTDDAPSPGEAAAAARVLVGALRASFGASVNLAHSPSVLGGVLLLMALPRGLPEWPELDPDVADVFATSGQGRIEWVAAGGAEPREQRWRTWDARWAYVSVLRELPLARWAIRDGYVDDATGVRSARCGRFLVEATCPSDWPFGFGLLPLPTDSTRSRWAWPVVRGAKFRTWVDAWELTLAQRMGWEPQVFKSCTPVHVVHGDILGSWRGKMLTVAQRVAHDPIARRMVRAILLHTIGKLAAKPAKVERRLPLDRMDEMPADATDERIEGDVVVFRVPSGQGFRGLYRPELAGTVWGRARVRLLDAPSATKGVRSGALHLAPGTVAAMRTDSLVTCDMSTRWADDDAPGRYRVSYEGRGPWPSHLNHLRTMRAEWSFDQVRAAGGMAVRNG